MDKQELLGLIILLGIIAEVIFFYSLGPFGLMILKLGGIVGILLAILLIIISETVDC
ncbi:MAG: hypothetical protein ACTSVA_06770 [Candidatus Njordarchaeales archaeon]